MKTNSLFLGVVVVFSLLLFSQNHSSADNVVVATGEAPLSLTNPKKKALHEAFRSAIEHEVGVNVSSESISKNFQILDDNIYAHSEGFIEKWEVLSEKKTAHSMILKIKAWVQEGRLNKRLFLNGLDVKKIYSWIGEPRVLILMQEFIDGKPSQMGIAQTEIENVFMEKGINVFHGMQLEKIKQRDKELSFKDPQKAVILGQRLGVEMVVSGKCVANFSRAIKIGSFTQNFYSANTHIRAYSTSTGELLLSANYGNKKSADLSALGKSDAAVIAIKNTINSSKFDILFKIVRNWYDGFSEPSAYYIIVENVDYEQLEALKIRFKDLSGVTKLTLRSFSNSVAELEIKYEGEPDGLIGEIIRAKMPYKITGKEQNRITLERKNQ